MSFRFGGGWDPNVLRFGLSSVGRSVLAVGNRVNNLLTLLLTNKGLVRRQFVQNVATYLAHLYRRVRSEAAEGGCPSQC